MSCQTPPHLLWSHTLAGSGPATNSLETSVTSSPCTATQAGQPSLDAVLVPRRGALPGDNGSGWAACPPSWRDGVWPWVLTALHVSHFKLFQSSAVAISCWSCLPSFFMWKRSRCLQRQLCLQASGECSAPPKIPIAPQPASTLRRTPNISRIRSSQDRYNAQNAKSRKTIQSRLSETGPAC